ncbi:Peptidoglycan O-acetyltransferase [Candidatus Venteria ishoeyi]|uniref:Peptidoglycan O-acetyltransferase n=2 Tax=Candidatus Venteria ishoeyi TaxID=1899563 RepID=A0A1H6F7R3_9GAMM|nr:Peptidoglycan O-acetyltransferase [Candidatus Venteria ishoeyi]
MQNFAFPYFSRDIAEFWRRWHISLSTWFRDYLYIPLGGSKGGILMKIRNTFIIFIVSGFWHGANWTFIVWGALNAIYFLPLLLSGKNRQNLGIVAEGKFLPNLRELLSMGITFSLTVLAWVFFRADSIGHAISYLSEIFSSSLFTLPAVFPKTTILLVFIFLILEWLGRGQQYAIAQLGVKWKRPLRWTLYYGLVIAILYFSGNQQEFIYFQF